MIHIDQIDSKWLQSQQIVDVVTILLKYINDKLVELNSNLNNPYREDWRNTEVGSFEEAMTAVISFTAIEHNLDKELCDFIRAQMLDYGTKILYDRY